MSTTPLTTSRSRVFIIEGRARGDHKPSYESCYKLGGLTQGLGDITKIECPDPYRYGSFIEIGQIRGATDRPTTNIEGRYMLNMKSTLMTLARKNCPIDIQMHLGLCQNPSIFNEFEKAVIFEDATLTSLGTDDLGALASGDDAEVNHNADVSAKEFYEVMPVGYGQKAGSIVTNEVIDVVICDAVSCGDCEAESSGCDRVYAVSKAAGGSSGTPPDILYSIDKGLVWYAHDINSLSNAEDPDGMACVGDYIVVVSNDSNSLHYALKSEMDGVTDPNWTEVTTGFVTGGEPNAIYSDGQVAFIVGDNGYIYYTEDPTTGVTVLDAGTVFIDPYTHVDGIGSDFVVIAGWNGRILYTDNGTTFAATLSPVGIGVNITALMVKSTTEWWVGTSAGNTYYTLDSGATWTLKAFPGSGSGTVEDIVRGTDSVLWMSHTTAAGHGRILRSFDGGQSWVITPEKAGTIPINDKINALAVCESDPNFVVGVGLADDGADGYVVVGSG